jgi:hypothetical protein
VAKGLKHVACSAAAFALLFLAMGISGCGSKATVGTVTAVSITPTSGSVIVNQQLSFTASVTVAGQNTTTTPSTVTANTAVTWYVNGVSGGNATYGTIVTDPSDVQVGIYTAPANVPSVNGGQISITATALRNPNATSGGGANLPVTSNTATITVSPGLGLQIVSPPATVPAGGLAQFNATLNGVSDPNATWTVSSSAGGDIGSINASSGVYQAPSFPPPGDTVTVTASDRGVTATTTVSITYSDSLLNGSFAFSYTGNDSQGFLAAAGSLVVDGKGGIAGGVEDVSSFLSGPATSVPIQIKNTSTYIVGVDGRGIANLQTSVGTQTLAFVLTTNQHAIITRFDTSSTGSITGSGSMDQQNLNDISGGSVSVISGAYVFSAIGTDASFNPEAIAGEFSASGGGITPVSGALDIHDGAASSATITTQASITSGTYSFDSSNSGSGRGTLSLITPAGSFQFAFYIVDGTELFLVENDNQAFLAGKVYSAATSSSGLAAANYVMTAGGSATLPGATTVGPYAIGGVFVSSGSGSVSGGTVDVNNQGTVTANAALGSSCGYTVDSTSGRIDLKLCPSGTGATTSEFALYPYQASSATQPQNFLVLEIDPSALSVGDAIQQTSTSALSSGGFALGLSGQGISHGSRSTSAQDVDGHLSGSSGSLDVNFFQPRSGDPITSANLGSPSSSGRGTLVISASSPLVTYNLVYYLVNANEALLFDQDANKALVLKGVLLRQF